MPTVTGFDDPEDFFGFQLAGFTRSESSVFSMLEGHFRRLDPVEVDPVLVVQACAGCGAVSVEDPNEQLSDLERAGLLAKALFVELDEQIAEEGDHDDL